MWNKTFQSKLDTRASENDTYRNMSINLQKDAQVERLTTHPTLVEVLRDFGLSSADFTGKSLDERAQFFADVPMLDVEIELFDESARNQARSTKSNDITDVTFLSAAIPNCDIVVGERYWIDIAIRRNLNNKYGTTLLKDINDLKPYLCI